MVHSLKPDPVTNIQDPDRYWDFMTLTPESTHMLTWLFSDEGIPASYAEMRGSGVHTFRWVNKYGEAKYVKYHWRPSEGIRNLSMEEAAEIQANDFQHATRDLYDRIEKATSQHGTYMFSLCRLAIMMNLIMIHVTQQKRGARKITRFKSRTHDTQPQS